MKPITPHTANHRYAAEQDVVWLLQLDFTDGPWLAATRAIVFDGEPHPARIAAPPQWRMKSARDFGAGGLVTSLARVRVNDLFGGAGSLRARLEEIQPLGLRATLRLLWIDAAGAWTDADAIVMFAGVVSDWRADAGAVELGLSDRLSAIADKRVGRVLVPAMTGGEPSPLAGEVLPIVIGCHDSLRLRELRPGVATRLAAPLAVGDAFARLVSVEGFPFSGSAQIGDEVVHYSAIDAEANTLGTAAQPIVRGQSVALHSKGATARSIPPGGFQWLVADHPCAAVADVRADGETLDEAEWTAETRALGAIEAQVVTMPRWPVRRRHAETPREDSARRLFGDSVHSISPDNTAANAAFAIDGKATSTAAQLTEADNLLAIRIDRRMGIEGPGVGLWRGARIVVRYSANRLWPPASQVRVRFRQDDELFIAVIPRPDAETTHAEVDALPGDDGERVDVPVGLRDFDLDLAPAVSPSTGWAAFDVAAPIEMQVEFDSAGQLDAPVTIFIHDIDLIVAHHPRLAPEIARAIEARVEGWPDGVGGAIENPADVIELLIAGARFGGVDAAEIDSTSLSALRDSLAARGFSFARVIAGGARLGDLLEEAAREATAWVRFGGAAIDFAPAPVFPATPDSIERLDEARALDAGAATRLVPPGREALADCFTLVARRSGAPAAPIWTHCAEGAEHAGSIPARREMRWLDGRDARALLHVGERTRREMQEPSSLHAQSFPIGAAPLEPGDPVVVHFAAQGLLESPATVESARLVSASRVEIVARGPVAGGFCWVHDAQTYLRAMSAGRRLVLYIGGAAVLNLERIGDLRIAGRLREEAGFSAPTQAAPLAFSGGYVYLAVGSAPAFAPFMRVDAQGDIDLNGTAREASLLEFAPTATCMEVDATRFSLAPTPGRGAFEFRASEGVLHLAGGVTEEIGV